MDFKGKGRKNDGITLIALVITIIVLLILAGVTIAMLSGNNSAPQKATEAAQKDAIAGAKDEIAMEVQEALLNYYNNEYVKGNVTTGASTRGKVVEAAKEAVRKAKERNKQLLESSGVTDYTITLETKSYTVTGTIEENGGITWSDTVASTGGTGEILTNAEKKEKINDAIGQDVNYSGYSSSYSGGWRVFYASEKEMFLISTDIASNKFLGSSGSENTGDLFGEKNAEADSGYTYSNVTYGADYNERWKTKLGGKLITNKKIRATIYLCDPKNWTEFISKSAPKGTYAVGAPTKELIALSWNEAKETGGKDAPSTTVTWEDSDVTDEGYLQDKPFYLYDDGNGGNPIRTTILNGLYYTGKSYWLASPCVGDDGRVMYNKQSAMSNGSYSYTGNRGIRPLVSIPISNVQIEENGTVRIVP